VIPVVCPEMKRAEKTAWKGTGCAKVVLSVDRSVLQEPRVTFVESR